MCAFPKTQWSNKLSSWTSNKWESMTAQSGDGAKNAMNCSRVRKSMRSTRRCISIWPRKLLSLVLRGKWRAETTFWQLRKLMGWSMILAKQLSIASVINVKKTRFSQSWVIYKILMEAVPFVVQLFVSRINVTHVQVRVVTYSV